MLIFHLHFTLIEFLLAKSGLSTDWGSNFHINEYEGERDNRETDWMISDTENTDVVNRKDAVNMLFVRGEAGDISDLNTAAI